VAALREDEASRLRLALTAGMTLPFSWRVSIAPCIEAASALGMPRSIVGVAVETGYGLLATFMSKAYPKMGSNIASLRA